MKNLEVRNAAKRLNVYLYQVADKIGISEATMTRRLRSELSEQDKQKILSIIEELSVENQEETA